MAKINFGYVLRKLRHGRDETLEQVSEATGLSVAMLSRVERGERLPSPDSVEALARHFEIPVDYLMSETIANRMVNRYGEKSSKSAAEHMSRDTRELGLFAPEPDPVLDADIGENRSPSGPQKQARRSYGVFREMDISSALGAPGDAESKWAATPAAADLRLVSSSPPETGAPGRSPALAGPPPASTDEQQPLIDPATQQVLVALRTAPWRRPRCWPCGKPGASRPKPGSNSSTSWETWQARRPMSSASSAKADPDRRVREAAKGALDQLGRP